MANETDESRFISIIDALNEHDKIVPISHEEFVKKAILKLRDVSKSRGIHAVFSGFNQAFRTYYAGDNPVEIINELVKKEKIEIRPVRGGVMLYLPGEGPVHNSDIGGQALKKILEE